MVTKGNSGTDIPVHEISFGSLRELKEFMLPNLSGEGLFLPTDAPAEPSTVLRFRLVLQDGFVLAEGTGVVVWSRFPDFDRSTPPGMGVRFVVLPEASRQVIEQLVAEHAEAGGTPFDLDHLPGDAEPDPALLEDLDDRGAERAPSLERIRLTVRDLSSLEGAAPGGSKRVPDLAVSAGSFLEEAEEATGGPRRFDQDDLPGPRRISGAIAAGDAEIDPRAAEGEPADPEAPGVPDPEPAEDRRGLGKWTWFVLAAVALAAAAVATVVVLRGRAETGAAHPASAVAVATPAPPTPGAEVPEDGADAVVPGEGGGEEPRQAEESAPVDRPAAVPPGTTREPLPGPNGVGVSWRIAEDSTVVALELAGGLSAEAVTVSRLPAPPRLLIRVPQATEPPSQLRLEVGSAEVVAVRSWLHSELRPPELHVVLDLAGDDIELLEVRREPQRVLLAVGPPG